VSLDFVSLKAFVKEGIRFSADNEKFTHWLPLYFGATDNKEKVLFLGQKALSFIMTSNTKRFSEAFVLEVFPKIIMTTFYLIMDQKRHPSIRYIRVLT